MFKRLITISITVGALVSLGIIAYKYYKFDDGSNSDSSNNDGDNNNNSRNNDSNNNNSNNNNYSSNSSNDNSNSSNNSNNDNDSDEEIEKESINELSEESVEKDQLEQQIVSTAVEAQQPSEPTQAEPEKPSEPQAIESEQSLVPQQQLATQQSLKPEPQYLVPQQQLEAPQQLKPEPQSEPEQNQEHPEDQAQQSWDVLFEKVKRREWIKSETKKLEESLGELSRQKGSSIHLSEDDKLRIRLFKQFPLFTRGLIRDLDDWEVKNDKKFIWEGTPYMDIITEESSNLNFKLLDLVYSFRDIK